MPCPHPLCATGILVGMPPARKRQQPSALTIEIAKLIDSAMAARRPRMTRAELARTTGIEQSQVSRMLAPTKPMFIEELVAICDAVGVDPGSLIREAERRAALSTTTPTKTESATLTTESATLARGDEPTPATHSTPVSIQDVREGGLPRQGGRPRRQRPARRAHVTHQHGQHDDDQTPE